MKSIARFASICLSNLGLLSLVACGGGSGGNSDGGAGASTPSSGTFSWVLKAEGPTDALKYGLSLVHPATPNIEYVVEFGSSVVTAAKLVVAGSVDAAGLKAASLRPYALVYIVGGDVRRVPMDANGVAPINRVQRARSTTACDFQLAANDEATPENSRFIVSTAGPDGQCGTGDDGRAEIRLDPTAGLIYTDLTDTPIGSFRNPATLAQQGWIYPRNAFFWGPGAGTLVTTRTSDQPAIASVVSSTHRSALIDDGTKLGVLDFSSGTMPAQTALDATLTGGGGWVGIGFDANSFYAYRNTSGPSWTVLRVSRSSPSATVLASGAGELDIASMGSTLLYVTVIGASNNFLYAVSKTVGVPPVTVEQSPSSTLTTVLTSSKGVHELWRVVNIGTSAVNYTVQFVDEAGSILYSTSSGGFPMSVTDASSLDFTTSENRTGFVFASGYGSRAFGDATLMGYDATAKAVTTFGALPGSIAFGSALVYASAQSGPGSFSSGFAAASADGSIQQSGAVVFSFDFATANSLKSTTAAQ